MIEFPKTYSVLLQGLPGVGKSEYCMQLARDYLEKGEHVVYVTTEKSPQDIRKRIKEIGLDLESYEGESFLFIDIFTRSVGTKEEKVLYVDNPSNLNLVSVRLSEASDALGKPIRIIFDSLSTFFLHTSEAEIRNFFESINTKIKIENGFALFTLHDEMHDEKAVVALKAIVLSVLEMEIEGAPSRKRMFRVAFAKQGVHHSPDWHEFKITKEGLEFVPVDDTKASREEKEAKEEKRKQLLTKVAIVAVVLLLGSIAVFQIMGELPSKQDEEFIRYQDNREVTAAPPLIGSDTTTGEPSESTTQAQTPEEPEIHISEFRLDGMEDAGNWFPMEGAGAYLDISESTEFSKVDKSMKVSIEMISEYDSYASIGLVTPELAGYDGLTIWSYVDEPIPLGRLEMAFEEKGGARYTYMRMRNLNKVGWVKDVVPFSDVRESPWSDYRDENGQFDIDEVKVLNIEVGGGPGGGLGTYVFYLDELNLFKYQNTTE
jgi:KaiC/GvpD/RAD55 family RecA-like ATPase